MSNLLQLKNGCKQFGAKVLFDQAAFAINVGEHVGVIGPNGAGKTTLFKILTNQQSLDQGEIIRSNKLRLGYLEQESDWSLEENADQFLADQCSKPLWELKQLGKDLGLSQEHFQTPLKNLSGGYRMRMKLLYLIGQEPDLMLLDEPTNFLDLESVLVLERFLQDYGSAFLLISHDREFLRRTTDSTLEIEGGSITKFPGHIDDYFEQKAALNQTLLAQAANQDAKRKQIQNFIDRFGAKATKARQAQSRMKMLEKMEKIEIKDLPVTAQISIPDPIHTGKESLRLSQADIGYSDKTILSNVNLALERGVHLGVVGFNGAGKSTLLKALAGVLKLNKGSLSYGYQVECSYYSQHSADQLASEDTVLSSLQKSAHPEIKAQQILNLAGSLLFSGDAIYKKISVLSGGEKSRVALGQMLLKKSPLLLLDEPTNHLDFETVEGLTEALRNYTGSIIVVSHDRSFIGRVSHQILEINNGRVEVFPGSYDEYVWSLQKGFLKNRVQQNEISMNSPQQYLVSENTKFNYKEESKKLLSQIKELERKITKTEEILFQLSKSTQELTQKLIETKGGNAQALAKELAIKKSEIENTEENLLSHMESLDELQKKLNQLKA